MICELHWTEYLRALGPTLIATIVAYIAWQQWRINRASLREKLFDRRMEIYSKCSDILREAYKDASIKDESISELALTLHQATFLFPKNVSDFITEFRSFLIDMRANQQMLPASKTEKERQQRNEQDAENLKQLPVYGNKMYKEFRPFLSFDEAN